jgi:hypothetical protein
VQEGTESFGVELEELRETIRGVTLDVRQMEQTVRTWREKHRRLKSQTGRRKEEE